MNNVHYVYKITNHHPIDSYKYYIGVRTAPNGNPYEDTKYMGSSKYLNNAIREQGLEYFSKEILSTWETRDEAFLEEIKLHEELNIIKNPEYYNKSKSKSTGFSCVTKENHFTTKMTEEEKKTHYEKLSKINRVKYYEQMERQGGHWTKLADENTKKEIYKKAGIAISRTRLLPENRKKYSESLKKAFIDRNQNSEKNPNAKTIRIFDDHDNLKFESVGSFVKVCEENHLPCGALTRSYKNDGEKLYQNISNQLMGKLTKNGYISFIGWYAKIV